MSRKRPSFSIIPKTMKYQFPVIRDRIHICPFKDRSCLPGCSRLDPEAAGEHWRSVGCRPITEKRRVYIKNPITAPVEDHAITNLPGCEGRAFICPSRATDCAQRVCEMIITSEPVPESSVEVDHDVRGFDQVSEMDQIDGLEPGQ